MELKLKIYLNVWEWGLRLNSGSISSYEYLMSLIFLNELKDCCFYVFETTFLEISQNLQTSFTGVFIRIFCRFDDLLYNLPS